MTTDLAVETSKEQDFDAIATALGETALGRSFLAEFARRHRSEEMRQIAAALDRIEHGLAARDATPALPSDAALQHAQQVKAVADQLDRLAKGMRAAGVDERFIMDIVRAAQAVASLTRVPAGVEPVAQPATTAKVTTATTAAATPDNKRAVAGEDPRLAALAQLDALTLPEKLALFA